MARLLAFVALAAVALAVPASSQILGVDLGSQYIKVAVVKPGLPFQIATNVNSKRKTPAAVSFYDGERSVGDDAMALASRKPHLVFPNLPRALGVSKEHPVAADVKVASRDAFPITSTEAGGLRVSVPGSEVPKPSADDSEAEDGADAAAMVHYSVEELTAMLLEYVKAFAGEYAQGKPRDMVITVPSYWTQHERRALLAAAELANVNVLGLTEENTAAAVQFAIDRKYNETAHVLIYNVGAHATQATVVAYDTVTKKEAGRNKTVGRGRIVGKAWDAALGGEHYTRLLINHIADDFNKRHGKGGEDIRSNTRAMAKIAKNAGKLKEILSANDQFLLYIESLTPDVDYKLAITRAEFEEMAQPLLDRQTLPAERALAAAGVSVDDLEAVEIIGGGVRVPSLKSRLSTFVNEKPLGVHLNGDEAMALGACFVAANRSKAFRVRKVLMTDVTPFPINVRLSSLPPADEEEAPSDTEEGTEGEDTAPRAWDESDETWTRRSQLFRHYNHMSSLKKISLPHDRDMRVVLHYNVTDKTGAPIPDHEIPDGTSLTVASYTVRGVSEATTGKHAALGTPKVQLSFALDANGIVELVKAEATLEELIEVEVEPEPTPEPEPATEEGEGEASSAPADAESEGTKDSDEKPSDATEDASATDSTQEAGTEAESDDSAESDPKEDGSAAEEAPQEPKKKVRRKVHRFPLKITEDFSVLEPAPLRGADMTTSRRALRDLARADRERAERAEAKNTLESYIYATRDKFEVEEEDMSKVALEETREEISTALMDSSEWLYDDGDDAPTHEYREKMSTLRALVDPVFERLEAMRERPELISKAREMIEAGRKRISEWKELKPQINETETQGVLDKVDDFERWLNDIVDQQEAAPLHEAPLFGGKDVAKRAESILSSMKRLERKPKPKPPKKAKKSNSTNTTESEDDQTADSEDAEEDVGSAAEGADVEVEAEAATSADSTDEGSAGEGAGEEDAAGVDADDEDEEL